MKTVDVLVPLPVWQAFSYSVPDGLSAGTGMRVTIPFGSKIMTGIVAGPSKNKRDGALKSISGVLDDRPFVSPDLLKLIYWMSDYYITPPGAVLRTVLPGELFIKSTGILRITAKDLPMPEGPAGQMLEFISSAKDITVKKALARFGTAAYKIIGALQRDNIIVVEEDMKIPKPKLKGMVYPCAGIEAVNDKIFYLYKSIERKLPLPLRDVKNFVKKKDLDAMGERGYIKVVMEEEVREPAEFSYAEGYGGEVAELTRYQKEHLREISAAVNSGSFGVYLLHGVTGSGKTEVYYRAVKEALEAGRRALILIPEISLVTQTAGYFISKFGGAVSVFHSKMSKGERFDQWRLALKGDKKIVIGPRSSVFTPLEDLGIIIVDEEQDGSYKQDEEPSYNARDIAVLRGKFSGCPVVLGSATPSVESYHKAKSGEYRYLEIPERVSGRGMPEIKVIDLRNEKMIPAGFTVSEPMYEGITAALAEKSQVILLRNRRGFATFVQCHQCGFIHRCPDCGISLTFHKSRNLMMCHYCGYGLKSTEDCPSCGEGRMKFSGTGTQKVEEGIKVLFPKAKVARIDVDVIERKFRLQEILKNFREGATDILVGTQLVAKGLNFPEVTLVCVINADSMLNIPDFRSKERTLFLLTQVAGRAGRGEKKGTVIVQTYNAEDTMHNYLIKHDIKGFYEEELALRRSLDYPPFAYFIRIVFTSENEKEMKPAAAAFRKSLEKFSLYNKITVMGPVHCPVEKVAKKSRMHILIKLHDRVKVGYPLKKYLSGLKDDYNRKKGLKVNFDVDPLDMM